MHVSKAKFEPIVITLIDMNIASGLLHLSEQALNDKDDILVILLVLHQTIPLQVFLVTSKKPVSTTKYYQKTFQI